MRAIDLQAIGNELAIKWDDGRETFVPLEVLRRRCPCAGCHGETDVLGKVYKTPDKPLAAGAFALKQIQSVGGYAVQPVWGDGHSTGLYSFDYLWRLSAG